MKNSPLVVRGEVATSTETGEAPTGKARQLSECGQPAPRRRISPVAICPSVSTTNSFSRARWRRCRSQHLPDESKYPIPLDANGMLLIRTTDQSSGSARATVMLLTNDARSHQRWSLGIVASVSVRPKAILRRHDNLYLPHHTFLVVPEVGIEPTLPEGNGILSPARLPVSPLRRGGNLNCTTRAHGEHRGNNRVSLTSCVTGSWRSYGGRGAGRNGPSSVDVWTAPADQTTRPGSECDRCRCARLSRNGSPADRRSTPGSPRSFPS